MRFNDFGQINPRLLFILFIIIVIILYLASIGFFNEGYSGGGGGIIIFPSDEISFDVSISPSNITYSEISRLNLTLISKVNKTLEYNITIKDQPQLYIEGGLQRQGKLFKLENVSFVNEIRPRGRINPGRIKIEVELDYNLVNSTQKSKITRQVELVLK